MPFSAERADRAVNFIQALPHTKGEYAGQPFTLQAWQRDDIIRPLFGTVNEDGNRQYRTAYIEIPRKNGKSALASGVANYLLYADNEPGAEIYGAAFTREQAGAVFNVARQMVNKTPALLRRSRVLDAVKRIVVPGTDSFYRAIPADDASAHGFNASGIIFDEVHTQRTRDLWDVLATSTGARRQPLTFAITTAGHDRLSICWELHCYAIGLLKLRGAIPADWYSDIPTAVVDDPTFFAYVRSIPDDWDWQDEANWHIANPALGTFRKLDEIRALAARAAQLPLLQNAFRRLYLNQWTATETRWLDIGVWDRSAGTVNPDILRGMDCYGGLDLAGTTDLAAFLLVFPGDEDAYKVISHFWIPGDGLEEREQRDHVPYRHWIKQGFITATPGDTINYDAIRKYIEQASDLYRIVEVGFDPWGAFEMAAKMNEAGQTVVPIRQNFQNMSAPSKELTRLLLDGHLEHGGNPVLRWMADNTVVIFDENENIRPSKKRSTQRIDGIVALIMAIDRAQRRVGRGSYDRHEVRMV